MIWRCSHPTSGSENGNCSVDLKKQVGVFLKGYQRVSRFELALKRLATVDYVELTSIAFELDYTDQSHFIKEFQEFAGMPPYNFVCNKSVGAESSSFLYIPIE